MLIGGGVGCHGVQAYEVLFGLHFFANDRPVATPAASATQAQFERLQTENSSTEGRLYRS